MRYRSNVRIGESMRKLFVVLGGTCLWLGGCATGPTRLDFAKPGVTVSAEEIGSFAAEKLPPFLTPRYVQVVDKFPVTPSGKVQKAELRKLGTKSAWDRRRA